MTPRSSDGRAIRSAGSAVIAGTPRLSAQSFKAATGANLDPNATVTSQLFEQLSCNGSVKSGKPPEAGNGLKVGDSVEQQEKEAKAIVSLVPSTVLKETSRSETPEHLQNEKAGEFYMNRLRRDNVSFLIGRVLPTSRGSHQELTRLKQMTPRTIETAQSATKLFHSDAQLAGAAPVDKRFVRRRDRNADYIDAIIRQAHVIRK